MVAQDVFSSYKAAQAVGALFHGMAEQFTFDEVFVLGFRMARAGAGWNSIKESVFAVYEELSGGGAWEAKEGALQEFVRTGKNAEVCVLAAHLLGVYLGKEDDARDLLLEVARTAGDGEVRFHVVYFLGRYRGFEGSTRDLLMEVAYQ